MTTSAYIPDKLTLYGPATPVWNTDLELDTSVFLSGDASIHVLGTSSKAVQVTEEQWPVSPGDVVSVDFVVRQHDRTVGNNLQLYLFWWDSAHGYLSGSTIYNDRLPAIDTWYRISGSDTAPASACYVTAGFYRPAVAFDVWLDEMGARKVQPAFRAHLSTNQEIAAVTGARVNFDHEDFDYGSVYDSATNYRFTAPSAGVYLVNVNCTSVHVAVDTHGDYLYLYKNGVSYTAMDKRYLIPSGSYTPLVGSMPVMLNQGDTLEIYYYNGDSVHTYLGADLSYFSVFKMQ